MKFINKSELKYILIALAFSFVLFVLVIPNFITSINGMNSIIAFIIFNVGIFVFLQIFLKAISNEKKFKLTYSIGLVILFMAIDILVPPISLSVNGQFAQGPLLIQSSSDYVIALGWNYLGINGFALFIFTYVVSPFLLFLASAILLKNFTREI